MILLKATTSVLRLASLAGILALIGSGPIRSGSPKANIDKLARIKVPDGYTVEVAAGPDLVDYPMFASTHQTGQLFVYESIAHVYKKTKDALDNPQFRIKILTDPESNGKYDKSTIYADKVGFPQGGVFYNGSLYATSAPDLFKSTDTDTDGVADKREVMLSGWVLNVNANSVIGPVVAPDGWLYVASAGTGFDITTKEGQRLKGKTGRIWRFRPDGSGLEWISAGRNKKKALSRAEIELLKTYQPEDPYSFEQRSFDLFFFSYYGNGMNLTDIANLRWKNLDLKAGSFSFIREKTHRTKKENQEPIVGKLRPETRAIIERWSEGLRLPEGYVFPFLKTGLTAKRERDILRQLVKVTNQYMRRIAGQLGIESDITTYWARHSFATALLRSEAPLGFISQALGHSDLKTTQAYLGSFDDEQTSKYLDAL